MPVFGRPRPREVSFENDVLLEEIPHSLSVRGVAEQNNGHILGPAALPHRRGIGGACGRGYSPCERSHGPTCEGWRGRGRWSRRRQCVRSCVVVGEGRHPKVSGESWEEDFQHECWRIRKHSNVTVVPSLCSAVRRAPPPRFHQLVLLPLIHMHVHAYIVNTRTSTTPSPCPSKRWLTQMSPLWSQDVFSFLDTEEDGSISKQELASLKRK